MWCMRVSLPWATFGLIIGTDGRVAEAAPVARWTAGRGWDEVAQYYARRGAEISWV